MSACDLVIRFGAVNTLIQFIQSRGRARKEGSKFIILVNPEEHARAKTMEAQEKTMDFVLQRHASQVGIPFKTTKDIHAALCGQGPAELPKPGPALSEMYLHSNAVVELNVCSEEHFDGQNLESLESELSQTLDMYGIVVDKIIFQKDRARYGQTSDLMFRQTDLKVLVQLKDEEEDSQEIFHLLQYMCVGWNFRLNNNPVFLKLNLKNQDKPEKSKAIWNLRKIGSGVLKDRQTFDMKYSLTMKSMTVSLPLEGKYLMVNFNDREYFAGELINDFDFELKISLLKTACHGFGLASWNEDTCLLCIPLANMPILKLIKNGEVTRVTSHPLLTHLAKYPVFYLQVNLASKEEWLSIRESFENPYVCPLNVLDSKIKVLRTDTVCHEEIGCQLEIPNDFMYSKQLLEDEWEVLIQASDFMIHPTVPEANKWIERIRSCYLNGDTVEARQVSTAVRLASRKGKTYWDSFDSLASDELGRLKSIDKTGKLAELGKPIVTFNQFSVLNLVVTPTRHVFLPSLPIAGSRLSRMISDKFSLIVVSFRDEYLNKSENDPGIHQKVKDCWINGIEICGRKIFPLCSSASQLRENKAFFVNAESHQQVDEIRKLIIPDSSRFKSSAKYLSRLGLFCTSDQPAGIVAADMLEKIDDERAQDGSLVTDGSGYVKQSLADKLFVEAKIVGSPSAIQFRYAGLKGVLTVLPDSHNVFAKCNKPILYRESQQKFESTHEEMGIVKVAKTHEVYLNRESITLLEGLYLCNEGMQNIWNFPTTLIGHLENYLDETSKILENKDNAKEELSNYIDQDVLEKISDSFNDIVIEPFFFRLLRCAHKIKVSDLCRRSNLPIKDGCLVMGIPDYSGKLETDQVFLQICKDGGNPLIVTGDVLIYRNPCLHPGDLRKVKAVDISELHYSKNVLILPGSNSNYSLAASCSGGDLDGDQFSVIWDKRYVPPSVLCQRPLDYENLSGYPSKVSENATSNDALAEFFVDCMQNEALGRVAHMHLALCDIQYKGSMDPLCKKLAESQAVAVDFPKTGERPDVPLEGLKIVNREGKPDFMEKSGLSYASKKVLGNLYRTCKSFLFTYDLDEAVDRKIPFDKSLDLHASEDLVEDARKVYKHYIVEMRRLMNQFALRQEEEVVLGRAVAWHPLLDSDRFKASQYLRDAYKALKGKYLQIFTDLGRNHDLKEWASAWYRVAYDQNIEFSNRPFLSFPWIAYEKLCEIKRETFKLPQLTTSYIENSLGATALKILQPEMDPLRTQLSKKTRICDQLDKKLTDTFGQGMFELKPYGSSSILLSDESSDIDIFVKILPKAREKDHTMIAGLVDDNDVRHFMRNYITLAADQVFSTKIDHIDHSIPLIKGVIDESYSVDICCNKNGLLKTYYILNLYKSDPAYFAVFWILVKWARYSGLIKFGGAENDEPLIETAVIYLLIIKLLDVDLQLDISEWDQLSMLPMPLLLDEVLANMIGHYDREGLQRRIGHLIHKFFRHAQTLEEDDLTLSLPIAGTTTASISKAQLNSIKKLCTRAMHMILFSRDVGELLMNAKDATATETCIVKKLSLRLSNALRPGMDFHQRNISAQTKAVVTITEGTDDLRLVFRAEGPRRAIADALNELGSLDYNNKAFTVGVPPKKASRYFMAGSTFMTVKRASTVNCKVGFKDCDGNYQPPHKTHQRSSPFLFRDHSYEPLDLWSQGQCMEDLKDKVTHQMNAFPLDNTQLKDSLEITTRFGTCYLLDVEDRLPKTWSSVSMEELISSFEKNKSMRSKVERKEFSKLRKIKETDKSFRMTKLKPARGGSAIDAARKLRLKESANKDTGLALSFLPGIVNPANKEFLAQISQSQELFKQTLYNLGFTNENCQKRLKRLRRGQSYFSANLSASTGKTTF